LSLPGRDACSAALLLCSQHQTLDWPDSRSTISAGFAKASIALAPRAVSALPMGESLASGDAPLHPNFTDGCGEPSPPTNPVGMPRRGVRRFGLPRCLRAAHGRKSGTSAMCPYRFLVGMPRRGVRREKSAGDQLTRAGPGVSPCGCLRRSTERPPGPPGWRSRPTIDRPS